MVRAFLELGKKCGSEREWAAPLQTTPVARFVPQKETIVRMANGLVCSGGVISSDR